MTGSDSGAGPRYRQDNGKRVGLSRRTLLQAALAGAAGVPIVREAAGQATPVATPGVTAPVVSPQATETWVEPWVWRPSDWPGQQLDLNVIENENPGPIVGFGNPTAVLFSYNGATPGPTIRMRGDETLLVRLRNLLGLNDGITYVGPYPDPAALPKNVSVDQVNAKAEHLGNVHHDYCLGEHTNGVHSAHDTNLHTHGLHVRPGRNPDGTHSDNVILRVIDPADLEIREDQAGTPQCAWLRDPDQTTFLAEDETVGFADYEFRLGDVQNRLRERQDSPPQPHPPGTHWYHPHCHGATHNQVASGMAGFLIIEGDVDAAINRELTGKPDPNPEEKTGDYDYIERLMFFQRVFNISTDPDAPTSELKSGGNASPGINGDQTPMTITMRPGAIERWRALNGSVDGRGFRRLMVVKGQYDVNETANQGGGVSYELIKLRDAETGTFTPVSRAEVSADKQQLYQLAFDGVTLIDTDGSEPTYAIADLAQQNAGTENPLDRELTGNPNQAMLANLEAVYVNADSIRDTWVRPNEVYLAPANRTDLFFQAPRLDGADSQVYTVLARDVLVHSDNFQANLQGNITSPNALSQPQDIVVAYIVVAEGKDASGNPLPPIPDYDVMRLIDVLPPVPEYLLPIPDDEVQVTPAAGDDPGDPDSGLPDRSGMYRTRTITYSGWGAADYPLITTEGDSDTATNFRAFVENDQASGAELEYLRYAPVSDSDEYVLLAPNIRTMAITGSTSDDIVDDTDPLFPIPGSMGRKFNPTDPERPRMLESTAEEWALYNYSISLWADTSVKPLGQTGSHYPAQPLIRADGQARFAEQPNDAKTWRIVTKSVDHPFHMHQNPFWVTRIEVPDENGNLVNVLDRPRWQDVVWIPRNGGRVIFRSRFPDFVGVYVNHCHILLHEDNGMMQVVEVTPFADQANYVTKDRVTSQDATSEEISEIYPRLDQAAAWRQSMQFVDPNHGTGQKYPGFVLGDPPG